MYLAVIAKQTKAGVSFPKLSKNSEKLPSKAYENWKFLILLPYACLDLQLDRDSHAWKMFTCLLEITRICCAYEISENQISYLSSKINEYFFYRKLAFPGVKLRPKHHYLTHLPYLIKKFGPTRYWWTLRFDSSHQFYKRCQGSSKNFINVTKSLTERRQLHQVLLSRRSLKRKGQPIFINEIFKFKENLYCFLYIEPLKNLLRFF
jgi:hypothetical protein